MVCPKCKKDWEDVGFSTTRKDTGYKDHLCKECGSHKKPVQSRVLVIPDTHYPFSKEGHLQFLKDVYDKYDCNAVVHLGDIIDNHYGSYHESDPDGFGGGEELEKALEDIRLLAEAFPNMFVCNGNHDSLPNRKAFSSGISNRWVKSIKEVITDYGIDVSGWQFADHFVVDGVKYCHGVGRVAKARMLQDSTSVVQGHYHARSSVEWLSNNRLTTFAMQLGALIDDDAYAFAYGKHFANSYHNCGVVIDGKVPIIEYM